MSSDWKVVHLADVASIRNGAGVKQEFFADFGIPLARVTNFTDSSIDLKDSVKVHPAHASKWKGHHLYAGDALVATVGSWPPNWASVVGKAVLVPPNAEGAIQNQNTCCVRALRGKANQRFVYYILKSDEFAHYAANCASGSANQARLPVSKLEEFTFNLPPLEEQQSIANLLGALDDRITLLRATNATLEAIAQALFKSWFVDFDPVRAKIEGRTPGGMDEATAALFPDYFEESELGLVPRGWRVGCVEELCTTITNGGTPSRSKPIFWEGGSIPWFKTGEFHDSFLLKPSERITDAALSGSSVKLLPENAILMAIYAAPTVGRLGILTERATFNQACTGMVAKAEVGSWFLFWTLFNGRDWFNSRANGAAQQNISKAIVAAYRVVLPVQPVLSAFNSAASALHDVIRLNAEKALALSELRDTLLPRLISGQLRLPEAQAVVEEVV